MKQNKRFLDKPAKKDIKEMIQRILQMEVAMIHIIDLKVTSEEEVIDNYDRLYRSEVYQKLKKLDIEVLNSNKEGFPLAKLRKAGFENIFSIVESDIVELENINGIGGITAGIILRRANAIYQEAAASSRVKFDYDKRLLEHTTIVNYVEFLIGCKDIFDEAFSLCDQYDDIVTEQLNKVVYMKSTLKWIFTSREKKEDCLRAYEYLENFLSLGIVERVFKLAEMVDVVDLCYYPEIAWRKFRKNTASFYSMLETIIPQKYGIAGLDGEPKYASDELVAAVQSFPLNTSLLKSVLRSYQVFGAKFILNQKRVLLGDEMGLGKTVQAIAAMAHLKAQGGQRFLVVCPVSVFINWQREIRNHSQLKVMDIYGSDREEKYEEWIREGGVGVTTYETLSRMDFKTPELDMLVMDEAHYIKNPGANRTKAFIALMTNAERILLMTGTPLENKVEEMKILVGYLQPEIVDKVSEIMSVANAEKFRQDVAPVYLRRTREDVLKELPDKLEKEEWCAMGEAEKNAYVESLKSKNFMKVRQVSWNVRDLRESGKAQRLLEICETAYWEKRKIIVYSYFKDTIKKVSKILGEKCKGVIDGSVPAEKRQRIIDEFEKADKGSVLVCQIVSAGVGLNIQSASIVIICEPQLKPSTENQAISRVYRMGQAHNVLVHRLLTADSVDEKLLEVLKKKTEIFNEFADESVVGEINMQESENEFMTSLIRSELEKYEEEKQIFTNG